MGRRIELCPLLVGGQVVLRGLEAVLFVSVGLIGFGVDGGSKFCLRKTLTGYSMPRIFRARFLTCVLRESFDLRRNSSSH
jgi:hypothetical protein